MPQRAHPRTRPGARRKGAPVQADKICSADRGLVGFIDKQRERANYERQALTALGELRIKSISSRSRLSPWQSACGMLERFYTREAAAQDSIKARCRVDSLKVPEPQPLLEDFVPPNIPSS